MPNQMWLMTSSAGKWVREDHLARSVSELVEAVFDSTGSSQVGTESVVPTFLSPVDGETADLRLHDRGAVLDVYRETLP